MTTRLYYHDSFLYDFEAEVREVQESPKPALFLDRTAFYPTSGGQVFDTGVISTENEKLKVTEVVDTQDGRVIHYLEAPPKSLQPGSKIRGQIDATRRRDHMQQHTGQHVLSAAFVRLFNIPTVSFHMADDYCSIDLDTPTLTKDQIEAAERLANEIILENRTVDIRFVTREEAGKLGLRKLPPAERDELRLIDIHDFDLSACGGTHVNQTGQIGCVLLRKTEKVRQGWRVEFVAGQRAVATARRDFTTLTEAAALFSAHIYDVPQQAGKSLEEIRNLRKQREQAQEELAEAQAAVLLAETPEASGHKLIIRTFADRDMNSLKLLAQKLTRRAPNVTALLATTSPQPSLVFAQSAGQPDDMGALIKQTLSKLGGRGGGSKDMAQGGVPNATGIESAIKDTAASLHS
ncbi:MAG TPA: alanine--tRNA ligase-related protein [Candidatus Sulfotelmatobacter sp.]|jgi:alanyl-tRNA synthetase|nr:alanine--tRNA ligase-related protein [Candidatus Sulfotelmatobacter sp.]